jgi:hypothetical protein
MLSRALLVDANIVVRAVLGKRVCDVFEAYAGDVTFFVPGQFPGLRPRALLRRCGFSVHAC